MGARVRQPIFIFGGISRSGCHYLQHLLAIHPECRLYPVFEDGILAGSEFLGFFTQRILSKYGKTGRERKRAEAAVMSEFGAGLLRFISSQAPRKRVVLTHPGPSGVQNFFKLFPEARLVFIVRDGRAVAESAVRSFPEATYDKTIRAWAEGGRRILDFKREHKRFRTQIFLVKYEDLVGNLEATLQELFRFLQLNPTRYDFGKARTLPVIGSSVFRNSRDPWAFPKKRSPSFNPLLRFAKWSSGLHSQFNRIAGDVATELGYELKRDPRKIRSEP